MDDEQIEVMYSENISEKRPDQDPIDTYPTIKLADFGLSVYSGPRNAGEFSGGTPSYYPPEQLDWGNWFQRQNRPINPADHWTAKHNIWAIGKVLYDFVTMSPVDRLDKIMTLEPPYLPLRDYLANDNHYLPERYCDPIMPYSLSLQQLVRDCLAPRPSDRPDPDELLSRTLSGLKEAREDVYEGTEATAPGHSSLYRLWYRGNEIHNMPLGPLPSDPNDDDWARATHRDPNGTPLKLPEQVWKAWLDAKARGEAPPAPPSPNRLAADVQLSQQKFDDEARKKHEKILAARKSRRAKLIGRRVPQPPATTGPAPAHQADPGPQPAPNRPFSPPQPTKGLNDDLLEGLLDIKNGYQQQNAGDSGTLPPPDRPLLSSSDGNKGPSLPPSQRRAQIKGKGRAKTPSQSRLRRARSSERASTGQPLSSQYQPQIQQTPSAEYQLRIQQTPSTEYLPPEQIQHIQDSQQPPVSPAQHQPPSQANRAPANPQAQLPTPEQYNGMVIEEMKKELKHRHVSVPQPARPGAHVRKSEYKRKLQEADRQGKTGRGAWKKNTRNKRRKKG